MATTQVSLSTSEVGFRENIGKALAQKYSSMWVGLTILMLFILIIVFADVIAPTDPLAQDLAFRLKPPTTEHPFGTDGLGRGIYLKRHFNGNGQNHRWAAKSVSGYSLCRLDIQ